MKNLLIATTALVATAGVAAADITFSGGARFGVKHTGSIAKTSDFDTATSDEKNAYDAVDTGVQTLHEARNDYEGSMKDAAAQAVLATAVEDQEDLEEAASKAAAALAKESDAKASKTDMTNRFTINIMGTAETDSGIEFFGKVRIRGGNEGNGATSGSSISAPRVGATMGGLTVAVGNINGAIDSLPGLYSGSVGLTGLSYSNVMVGGYDGFSSAGGGTNGVEVIYSASGLGVHLSHSGLVAGDRTALGLSYAFGDWKIALGHQSADLDAQDFTVLTVDGAIGSVSVGAQIADVAAGSAFQIHAGFEVGAGTNVTVFMADTDGATDTAYGLGFTHSLGGATLAGGIVSDAAGVTHADLGVRFKF